MDFCANDDMLDLAAYESASFFDMITGDCFEYDDAEAAYEAQYSHFYNDNGEKSYVASVGKKNYSGSIDADSSWKKKLAFHAKRVGLRILVAIINAFKAIGEALRKVLQVFLIPLNALIQGVTGRPNEGLAILTKEEKIVWDRLKREAESKIANVGRYGVQELCKRIDAGFDLTAKAAKWTNDTFAKGMNYQLVGLESDKFDKMTDDYEKLKDSFSQLKDKLNSDLISVDRARESIQNDAKQIKSSYYRKALLVYMTISKTEVKYAIDKSRDLNNKDKVSSSGFEISTDVNKISSQYQKISVLCNDMVAYLTTFLSKFNIKSKVESTGAGAQK